MAVWGSRALLFLAVVLILLPRRGEARFNRSSFPAGFVFGTSSSAYQYEGAAKEGGRGPSIWDSFTHLHPDKVADGSNGDVAVDQYHRYKEDVHIMKDIGMDAYRFSISWTRILPNGSLSGGVNKEGVNYYNNLINELLSKGLQPFATIFHWDTPQALEDKYGSFLSQEIIKDYVDYTDVCFKEFGDRVKHWITFNEPWSFCSYGYATGVFAPGRCSPWEQGKCSVGDSGREPYTVCHHLLLAHAEAVRLYKEKYQAKQNGKIGITIISHWFLPYSTNNSNDEAAQRALDFMYGWLMDPLTRGDYPFSMRALVGNRLPKFTREQSQLVKGSIDFLGLNYYTTYYTYPLPSSNGINISYTTDSRTYTTGFRKGVAIGPQAATNILFIYPRGIRDLLLYTKAKYNNPVIYITENGVDEASKKNESLQEDLSDEYRIKSYDKHLLYILSAIRDGVDVRGFFAWSLLDNFEWSSGYTVRFGINFVDFNDGLKRYPKRSAIWFKRFLKK